MADIYKSDGTPIPLPTTSVTPILQTGTLIATIGGKQIFAPRQTETVVTPILQTGTKIAEIGGKNIFAPNSSGDGGSSGRIPFSSYRGSALLAQNEYLLLPQVHIMKNIVLTARIDGTISNDGVLVGVGYHTNSNYINRDYNARWIVITPTNLILCSSYNYTSESQVRKVTFAHGLTLTANTDIVIYTEDADLSKTYIRLSNGLGDEVTFEKDEWGVGIPFAQNKGANSVTVSLSFMPRDLNRSIWVFADSYFSFTTPTRLAYHLHILGFSKWLSNNQPGLSPINGNVDFSNLLSTGYKPVYAVYMLGMNGSTTESKVDGEYVINSYQKQYIDLFIETCGKNGVIPILATIPTVPASDSITEDSGLSNAAGRQKTGLSKYVRSLGCRYIDMALAVGADEYGNWRTGLLSSDFVHPTAAGAKVLADRMLLDFPEFAVMQ